MSYNSLFGYGSHLPDANLEGHWLLQENAANNTVSDRSGNGNNGTLTAGNTEDYDVTGPKVGGYLPSGLSFPTNGVSVPDAASLDVTSAFTMLGWNNRASGEPRLLYKYVTTGNQRSFQLYSDFDSIKLESSSDGTSGTFATVDIAVDSLSTNTWGHFAASLSGGSLTAYRNGVAGTPAAQQNLFASTSPLVIGTAAVRLADVAIFSRGLSSTEVSEHKDGPEPLNTTLPTLTIDSTSWSGNVGTWDSQSNGAVSCEWELRDADTNAMVEQGSGVVSGGSVGGSGSYSGSYYLWVRASNLGGFDDTDSVRQSANATVSGGTPSGSGSLTAVGTLSGVGTSTRSGTGSISAVGSLDGIGLSVRAGSGSITAIGTLAGVGVSVRSGPGSNNAIGTLTGVGEAPALAEASGSGSITAVGTLAGTGVSIRSGDGAISAIGVLAGVGSAPVVGGASGSGTITAIAALSGVGTSVSRGTGSIDAIGTLSGTGVSVRSGSGTITAIGSLAGVGTAPAVGGVSGSGTILAIGTLSGVGTSTRSGSGSVSAIGSMVAAGATTRSGAGAINAVASLNGLGSNGESTTSPAFLYYYYLAN